MLLSLEKLVETYKLNITGILHCGASTGQEASKYSALGIKKVIWVEAIPHIYEKLKQNVESYEGNIAINACLSDEDGQEVDFNISSNDGESSSFLDFGTHKEIHPDVTFVSKIRLITSRLDSILSSTDLEGINFLNFDLQGAELLALHGLGDYIKNIQYCYLEVNKQETYQGCALVGDIDNYLADYGLQRIITADWVGDTWTDALYVKK